jgi:hypothetical protein
MEADEGENGDGLELARRAELPLLLLLLVVVPLLLVDFVMLN